jgi:hypothetical protein
MARRQRAAQMLRFVEVCPCPAIVVSNVKPLPKSAHVNSEMLQTASHCIVPL